MTTDPALVTRKLLLIAADLAALEPVAAGGEAAYPASLRDQAFVERYLERMIGRMIDVNYHLITGSGQPPPSDYHGSFLKLGDTGVLEPAFARAIARAAACGTGSSTSTRNSIDHWSSPRLETRCVRFRNTSIRSTGTWRPAAIGADAGHREEARADG